MNPLEKNRPKTLEEYGPSMHATTAVSYARAVQNGGASKACALLTGPAGCGKTTLVWCLASSMGLDLADGNASDERSAASIRSAANAAMNGVAVFLDEADQIGTREQKLFAKLAPKFTAPVFLACNDDGKICRELKDVCLQIHVPYPSRNQLRAIGKKVKASPRAIVQAASYRDLVHQSGAAIGEFTQKESVAAMLDGDAEAGTTTDLMRAEPWIMDNVSTIKAPLAYDLWRSRYRQVGSTMEKYARHSAAKIGVKEVKFPWSLALRGQAKRKRLAAEKARKAEEKASRAEEKAADAEALKEARERAANEAASESAEEWV